jgi:hypothetical protein
MNLNNENDKRLWKLDEKKGFSVKSLYSFLTKNDNSRSKSVPYKQIWKSKTPPRIAFFAWEATNECILTLDMLKRKGNVLVNRSY